MYASRHARTRMRQRAIPETSVDLILEYGVATPRPGGAREIRIPKMMRSRLIRQVKAVLKELEAIDRKAVLVSDDGAIITIYHCR
jgi:hypothetical protein